MDRSTLQPLAGANIAIPGARIGTTCGADGQFLLKTVPAGTYQLKASMIGYRPEVHTAVVVSANRVTKVDFELSEEALDLGEETVVSAGYFEKNPEMPTSARSLTPREISVSPGAIGDIFRVMQSMPGVALADSRNSNLIVRGGNPDQNRTLLENMEIVNPLHFGRQGGTNGGISIVNPAILKRVDLLTGGFPAKYGDKLSSVVEMQLKDGNRTGFNTDLNVNLTGFGMLLDGPAPGGGTAMFTARRGVFDLLTSLLNRDVSPRYWDAVGKATYDIGARHSLSLIGFYYLDDFEDPADPDDEEELGRKYDQKRDIYGSAIGLNWRYLFSHRGYVRGTAALISNGWTSSRGTGDDPQLMGDDTGEDELHLKAEATYKLSDKVDVTGGLFWKGIDSDHQIWSIADTTRTGAIAPAYQARYDAPFTYKAGSHLQAALRPVPWLSLSAGARCDYYEFTGESKVSPRLGLTYSLTDRTTLNAAYGHFYQTPGTHQVAMHPDNTALHSARAAHYIAGIEHMLRPDVRVSVEVYHKDMDHLFVGSDTSRVLSNAGSGHARGVELYVQKKMTGKLVGSAAYTYAISRRQDGPGLTEFRSDFDRPHSLTLVAGYGLSDKWRIGMKFQYASGNPHTPIDGAAQREGEWYVVDGDENTARCPDYHKLDVRIDRSFRFRDWTLLAYLDLWNAYGRDNVLSYWYEVDDDGAITRESSSGFPLFPILGLSARF